MTQQSDFVVVPRDVAENLKDRLANLLCRPDCDDDYCAISAALASPPQPAAPDVVEALRDAAETFADYHDIGDYADEDHPLTLLRQAIERYEATRQPAQGIEPVAYCVMDGDKPYGVTLSKASAENYAGSKRTITPLYTHPPAPDREKLLGLAEAWSQKIDRRAGISAADCIDELRAELGVGGV